MAAARPVGKWSGPGELKLENGERATYGGMGMLWYSKEKFGNCQIKVVFELTSPDNNGARFESNVQSQHE